MANDQPSGPLDDVPALTERKYEKISKELRKLQFINPGPQMRGTTSERESRRRVRSLQTLPSQPPPSTLPPAALESQRWTKKDGGLVREGSEDLHNDLCDCLDLECPGCFLPCPKCGCNKCGSICRVGRAWDYIEEISRETGSDYEDW